MSDDPPKGSQAAGRRLWRSVLGAFDLDEHELALLRQAARTADVCEVLQGLVDAEGAMREGRAHPALVELRQQRIVLARLLVALRVPLGEESEGSDRLQRRGTRGVYGIRGGVG
ncbi:MAG: terminase [Actinomycetota bacterium]|nr:terminase [Actinomycetota bacterium]